MKKKMLIGTLASLMAISCTGCKRTGKDTAKEQTPTLTMIGHASVKIKTSKGVVIYIDPYEEGEYKEEADIILVTHQHDDHNRVDLITQKKDTIVITNKEALIGGVHQKFEEKGVIIEAVPAENSNHPRTECVGYVLSFDGVKLYHSGDTNYIDDMKKLKGQEITYAMFPIDGIYNMDAAEATKCAETVGAVHNIAMHTDFYNYNQKKVAQFNPKGKQEVTFGETIHLKAD